MVARFMASSFMCVALLAVNVAAQERDKDAEILKLKDELRQAQRQLEQAVRAGFVPVEGGFSSAQEILNSLTKELELRSTKPWDTFQWEEVKKHIRAEAVGKPFAAKLRVSNIRINPNREAAKNPSLPKFEVEILLASEQFPIRGVLVEQELFRLVPLTLTGDDDLAEKARKIQKGKAYEVRGILTEVGLSGEIEKLKVKLEITRCQFGPFE